MCDSQFIHPIHPCDSVGKQLTWNLCEKERGRATQAYHHPTRQRLPHATDWIKRRRRRPRPLTCDRAYKQLPVSTMFSSCFAMVSPSLTDIAYFFLPPSPPHPASSPSPSPPELPLSFPIDKTKTHSYLGTLALVSLFLPLATRRLSISIAIAALLHPVTENSITYLFFLFAGERTTHQVRRRVNSTLHFLPIQLHPLSAALCVMWLKTASNFRHSCKFTWIIFVTVPKFNIQCATVNTWQRKDSVSEGMTCVWWKVRLWSGPSEGNTPLSQQWSC